MMCISSSIRVFAAKEHSAVTVDEAGLDVDVDLTRAELIEDKYGRLGVMLMSGKVILIPRKGVD